MTTNPNRGSKRAARLCISIILVVSGLAGFVVTQRREPPPPYPNWPETLSYFRFRWSADPGIDLLSGPAVPLRAYLESYRLAYFTVGINAAYPGFEHAVPEAMEGPFLLASPTNCGISDQHMPLALSASTTAMSISTSSNSPLLKPATALIFAMASTKSSAKAATPAIRTTCQSSTGRPTLALTTSTVSKCGA